MALIDLNFFSYTLGMDTSVKVLLPEKRQQPPVPAFDKKYPVLYLLHGHSDDQTSWIRKSLIELLIRDLDLIAVMATTHRASYSNGLHTHKYFDFFADELPVVIGNFFPASLNRNDTFVAGISMGGYGAFKLALSRPEQYCAAVSLSGALSQMQILNKGLASGMFTVSDFTDNFKRTFGDSSKYSGSEHDLQYLFRQCVKKELIPRLFITVGQEDPIYDASRKFMEFIHHEKPEYNLRYEEYSGGHDWSFWNDRMSSVIEFLNIS